MSKRTRRQFIGESVAVAAAAASAGSARSLMADDQQSSSPNEKLSVAVVGVRGRGNSHIGAFSGRRDTEVTWICDIDSEVGNRRADEVANRQGRRPQITDDIRRMLEDDSIDIVTVATPNHWHALAAIWAIQAGKDVYLEKPVSHNVSEGRRVVEAARKYGKIVQTGTQSRSSRGMREAMEFIQSGGIGEVKLARGLCYKGRGSIGPSGSYDVPESVNYDLWLGPAPMAGLTRRQFHYDWHWQWAYGNGDLGNQGIHQMDLARWGLGLDRLPDGVISYGGRFGYEDAGETANTQVNVYDFGEKSIVFEVRGLRTGEYKNGKVGVLFEGTEGSLTMWSYNAGAAWDNDGNEIRRFEGGGDHFANFLTAVRSRKIEDLHADIEQGHLSSALCHLGNISYRLGQEMGVDEAGERLETVRCTDNVRATLDRTVEHLRENNIDLAASQLRVGDFKVFDPTSERFPDCEQSCQMLTREYRTPFVVPAAGEV